MPHTIDPKAFINTLLPVVRQCAETSLIFFGKVSDIGKAEDTSLDSQIAREASSALTVIDNALQEIILNTVLQAFPGIRCIAEEATPLKRHFAGNQSPYTVILDPIDGTYHFRKGDAPYHVSLGLARDGYMEAAIVARPSENKIFTATRGLGAYVQVGTTRKTRLRLGRKATTKKAYISTKATDYHSAVKPHLKPQAFPIGAALALTGVAEGAFCAYLTRQVEVYDVGPPSLIAEEAGARCFLKDGSAPTYKRRRKFGHYACASTPELEVLLMDVLREGAPG
jgi:myo-inositol-1(or 4)-monophosphatase